jgi:FAD/FMN-containing dehydrogenase
MEHPLRVDEFRPSDAPPTAAAEDESAPPLVEAIATPLPPVPNLPASDVQFLRPSDQHYADFLPAASKRKQLAPELRAICKTEHAVAVMVDWVRSNELTFATRCGGHSYEGLSQTTGVAIDVRGLKQITVDKASEFVTIGSGVSLFELYSALAAKGLALQAGSCPTVGISGHLTGGGHGLLARSHGLTCDALVEVTLVDAQARVLRANAQSEPNLYWACRGGGGGSFGIATEFKIKVFPLSSVLVFGVSRNLSRAHAALLFSTWQDWAPNAPSNITSIMKVGPAGNGLITMRCIGQSVGSEIDVGGAGQERPHCGIDPPNLRQMGGRVGGTAPA